VWALPTPGGPDDFPLARATGGLARPVTRILACRSGARPIGVLVLLVVVLTAVYVATVAEPFTR
jgi:hypothetical protein